MTQETEIRLRAAARGDIPDIVRVHNSSVSESEDVGFGTPRAKQTFADIERLSNAWREPNRVHTEDVFVAECAGHVAAYVTVEDRGRSLELVNIDVTIAMQGRGIGTRLVGFIEDRARGLGCGAVTLGTSRNAQGVPWKSLPWWQHLGYQITHEEENEWTRSIGPGVREIRMRKDLA